METPPQKPLGHDKLCECRECQEYSAYVAYLVAAMDTALDDEPSEEEP